MDNLIAFFLGPVDALIFLGLVAVVFTGAFITSGFGIGGGMFMTPIILLFLPPKFGIGLLGPTLLLMSGTGIRQYWKQWDRRCLWVILPAMMTGIWGGTYLLGRFCGYRQEDCRRAGRLFWSSPIIGNGPA